MKKKMEEAGRLVVVSQEDRKDVLVKPPQPHKSFYSYEIRQEGEIEFKP